MSAATQNHVYSYGPKKAGVKDAHVLSTERLKEIKESLQKYRTEKKQWSFLKNSLTRIMWGWHGISKSALILAIIQIITLNISVLTL